MQLDSVVGVASARHSSCLVVSPGVFDVAVGCNINRWDISGSAPSRRFQVSHHESAVTCMRQLGGMILTVGYNGDIALWNTDWKLEATAKAPKGKVSHLSIALDSLHFATCSEEGEGVLTIWEIHDDAQKDAERAAEDRSVPEVTPSQGGAFSSLYTLTSFIYHPQMDTPETETSYRPLHPPQEAPRPSKETGKGQKRIVKKVEIKGHMPWCEWNSFGQLVAVRRQGTSVSLVLFSESGLEQLSRQIKSMEVTCMSKSPSGEIGLSYLDRSLEVVDEATLQERWKGKGEGSGPLKALGWWGKENGGGAAMLICPSTDGKWRVYSRLGLEIQLAGPASQVYHFSWLRERKTLLALSIDSAHVVRAPLKDQIIGLEAPSCPLSLHSISCSALAISPRSDFVATGDFAGQVLVWKIPQSSSSSSSSSPSASLSTSLDWKPSFKASVGVGVRSLVWRESTIVMGLMNGVVMSWSPWKDHPAANPEFKLALEGSITALAWCPTASRKMSSSSATNTKGRGGGKKETDSSSVPPLLAIGTTSGTLALYTQKGHNLCANLVFLAHPPRPDLSSTKLGSIHNMAEIWSLSWSPDSLCLATCSEDMTTKIWSREGGFLASLTGHTSAVTCVDWAKTDCGTFLATCGDDRYVRLWKTDSWSDIEPPKWDTQSFFHSFSPPRSPDGAETLTYLKLEAGGSRLVVGTLRGVIHVFSLSSKSITHTNKVHLGSLEGMDWVDTSLVTVSSDCTVNIFNTRN